MRVLVLLSFFSLGLSGLVRDWVPAPLSQPWNLTIWALHVQFISLGVSVPPPHPKPMLQGHSFEASIKLQRLVGSPRTQVPLRPASASLRIRDLTLQLPSSQQPEAHSCPQPFVVRAQPHPILGSSICHPENVLVAVLPRGRKSLLPSILMT